MAGALRAGSRVEPPLDQLRGYDASPSEPIAEIDVDVANRGLSLLGKLLENGERFVSAIELVGENAAELLREGDDFFGVRLDLDPLRQELRELAPLLRLFAEVAQAGERVEVVGVGREHDVERA